MSESNAARDIIRIEGLGKTFRGAAGEIVALQDIDLTVREGEIFGIIGLSGAGKSTLVRCINYLEEPTAGRVIVDGKDLSAMSRKELLKTRQKMGMIFQGFNLLSQRNALGNVCYPLEIAGVPRAAAKARAQELLRLVGLEERMYAYPSQMSGGQQQRVAIARALANDPKVLLCDEATSALDPTTTQSILELLQQINRELKVTVVVITHEMRVIDQICDRVAVIDQSHIAEIGDVSDVFANPRSRIAKELILPSSPLARGDHNGRCIRLIFDGQTPDRPVLSDLIIACQVPISVLYADTKSIRGVTYGNMLLSLPEEDAARQKVFAWLDANGITYSKEVG